MLARLLDDTKALLAEDEDEEYDTSRNQGPDGTKTNKEENPTVNWQGGPLLMTVGSGCFQNIRTGTSASSNIRIGTI